jgi:transcriptional regulator with XRE-family HTH domain
VKSLGEMLRQNREAKGLLLRQVAAALDLDTGLLSKYEREERMPNKEQVIAFANYYMVNPDELLVAWLSDRLAYDVQDEELGLQAMKVAEQKIRYKKTKK